MARAAPLQANFNAGELDARMHGRVDYDRLRSALAVCLNHIPRVTGSITRRPGTYFCDEVKDSTKATRCVRFKYSTIQAYVLEFGDQYIRFKKNQGPITSPLLNITGITQGNPGVVSYTGTDPANGAHLELVTILGMTELDGRRVMVANVDAGANTFELHNVDGSNIDTTTFGTFTGGIAHEVYEIASPYLEADLFQLKFRQNADTLYIWHPDYPERTLTRAGDTAWALSQATLIDGPYLSENTGPVTMTPSAATGSGVTLTASGAVGINGGQGFLVTDVGRLIRLKSSTGVWGYVLITGYTSTTVVTVTVINTLTNTTARSAWRMGLYSDTTGYPACGTFYGDRLYRAGCPEQPDRFDASMVSDYLNMSPTDTSTSATVTDAHAVSRRLNEDDVQAIRWMRGTGNGLIAGTLEGEWLISPSTNSEAITPSNVDAKMSTPYGSADIDPTKAGTAVIFVESGGRRVREAGYQYYDNLLQISDMTVLSESITKGDYDPADPLAHVSTVARSGVKELAYQRKPIPVIWAVRKDGVLIGNTFSKDEKVTGWHRHIVGGWSNAGHTAHAEVESCCVIPSSDESYDECWMVVKRYINGRTVRYFEFLTLPHEQGSDRNQAVHSDCTLTYAGEPTTDIVGLHHLAGETVQILADGATHPDVLVSQTGSITLNREASVVHVGYAYNSDGATLRFDVGAEDGTALGKLQRMHYVDFLLYEALGLSVGRSFDALREIPFRNAADPMGSPPPLFNGIKGVSWDGDFSKGEVVCWRFSTTLPGEILALLPRMQTNDGG
jgi:hypothetical protein